MLTILLSLTALQVVAATTCSAVREYKVVNVTASPLSADLRPGPVLHIFGLSTKQIRSDAAELPESQVALDDYFL